MHFRPLAYLDPGSGSVLIQLVLAALLGAGVALRLFWTRIKGWLGIKSRPEEDDDDNDN